MKVKVVRCYCVLLRADRNTLDLVLGSGHDLRDLRVNRHSERCCGRVSPAHDTSGRVLME